MGSPVRSGSWIQGMQTPSQELALAKLFGYLRKPWRNLRGAGRRPVERLLQPNPLRRPTDIGPSTKYPKVSLAVWTAKQAALARKRPWALCIFWR